MREFLENLSHKFDVRWEYFGRIRDGEKILELGCGSGINMDILSCFHKDVSLFGVDISKADRLPPTVSFAQVDLNNDALPFPDNHFNVVIFTHVIEHLHRIDHIGREIHRVLKPGGSIYLETPNWTTLMIPSFGFGRDQGNPFNFYDDHTHVRPFTKHSIFVFLSDNCKLNVERIGTVRNWPRLPWDFIKIARSLLHSDRKKLINAFWNIYGWCIFGIGVKR